MARAPQPSANQVTMREIIARFDGLSERIDAAAKDAREGRDAALGLTARLSADNTQEQLTQIWARMEKSDAAHRSDLQNAYARLKEEEAKRAADLDVDRTAWKKRIEALETWRNKIEGANGLLGWVAKHSPWLVTVAIAALAMLKVKAP